MQLHEREKGVSDGFSLKIDHIPHDQAKVTRTNQEAGNRWIPDLNRLITLKISCSGEGLPMGSITQASRGLLKLKQRD